MSKTVCQLKQKRNILDLPAAQGRLYINACQVGTE